VVGLELIAAGAFYAFTTELAEPGLDWSKNQPPGKAAQAIYQRLCTLSSEE
jgi:hypothetical protein